MNGFKDFDIDKLSVEELKDKKIIREIFNICNSELKIEDACNKLLARAKSFKNDDEVEKIVKDYVLEFLERNRRKKEAVRDKNKKLEWHLEVRRKREAEEERKRLRRKQRELDKLDKQKLEDLRKLEYEEIKKGYEEALDTPDIVESSFVYKKDGTLDLKSIVNHDLVVQNDKYIKEHVRFNVFKNNLEFDGRDFKNSDLLNISSYLDRTYGLRDANLIWNALNRPGNVISYHPIKDIIEDEKWDGVPRIDDFFKNICNTVVKDENSKIYYREVARMLFFGGIQRLYEPGSKFDYMIILKGKQGTCKTTLVRLLALDDSAYTEVTTMDGQTAIELVSGSWMCELAELLAMVKAREVENIKAFITRQYDKYRPPYARTSEIIPRSCIFIGTTNDIQFMTDMTGNRRYLPVEVNTDATEFFKKEDEIKEYILQCWREAFYKYINGEIYTTIPVEYFKILEDVREYYVDDNPLEGLIKEYLDSLPVGYEVCGLEIFVKCFNGIRSKFTSTDSKIIATIMNKYPNWVRHNERKSFKEEGYGQQRYWSKVSE